MQLFVFPWHIEKKHDDKEVKFIITIIKRYKVYSLTSFEVGTLCMHRYLQLEDLLFPDRMHE